MIIQQAAGIRSSESSLISDAFKPFADEANQGYLRTLNQWLIVGPAQNLVDKQS